MKCKKLMLVALLLLAILSIGAVSAVENTNDTLTADDTDELSQDLDDEITSIEETDIQAKEVDDDKLTKAQIVDHSVDSSDTIIYGELILTDNTTGQIFKRNITSDLIKSSMTNPGNYTSNATEIMNQLLSIAQTQAGDKAVTVKTQNVSSKADSRYDNRAYTWIDDETAGGYLEISQDYGTKWIVNVTVIAEYASGYIISFNATGGEGVMENISVANNANYTLPECGFTKEYRVFYGWNVGDAIKQPGENITVTDNITVKTVWKYDIDFDNSTPGKVKVMNLAVDLSTTSISGILLLTDTRTGELIIKNVTVGPVNSIYNNADYSNTTDDMINETVNQLLSIAQAQAGSKIVTIKNKTVSDVISTQLKDTRKFGYVPYYEGADDLIEAGTVMVITGSYGTNWTYPFLFEAEYSSDIVNVSNVKVILSKNTFTYNAKVQKPTVTVINGLILKEGVDYTLLWSTDSPKKAGTYTITVTGAGAYIGTTKVTFKINKAANPLKVKAKTVKVKFSKLKKKAQKLKVTKVVKFTKKGQGTLTYKKVKGNKKITINKKTGKVTIKKGLKKGTYKVKVKIKANGNANYKASAFKTITFKIKVK